MIIAVKQLLTNSFLSLRSKGSFANNIKYYTLYFFVTFIIQLIFTPVIARIFTAESYGTFSLVTSMATYASLVFTLQLEPAIVVAKSEGASRIISRAIFTINSIALVLSYLILAGVFAYFYFSSTFSFEKISYLLWVPLLSFLIASHNVYGNVANRSKKYKKIYQVMSPTYLAAKLTTVGWGKFIGNTFFGLYLGEILFRTVAVVLGFKYIIGGKLSTHLGFLSFTRAYNVAKKNANYIFYELPLRLVSLLSSQMPIYFLAIYYDVNKVGQFAFANAFLEIPVRLISYSFATVFFQKSSEVINSGGTMLKRSVKMLGGLFLLGVPPFFLLYLFSDQIFALLFGKQWGYASELAVSLVLFYFSRFVFEPFQVLFRVLGKQRIQFFTTVCYFLIFGVYLFFSMRDKGELTHIFRVMSLLSLAYFLIQTVYIFQLLRVRKS
jgi:O-antigen/teichoic acid export membrane protein